MTKILEHREALLPYIGHFMDGEQRYQLNGAIVKDGILELHVYDRLAEDEGEALLEWSLRGLKLTYDFLDGLGQLDDADYDRAFPYAGKLS